MVASFHQLLAPVGTVSMALGDIMLALAEIYFSLLALTDERRLLYT
jgi:hypothetical protein